MNENMVYIPLKLFNELIELKGRVKAFEAHTINTKFSIEREECAAMLGFDLKKDGENA